ncbi:CCM1 [Symbiodinium sp. KB8]|nr:CCM1 [Symbiodinium sp. KB8]
MAVSEPMVGSVRRLNEQEVQFLQEVFDKFDEEGTGKVHTTQLEAMLDAIGRNPGEASNLLKDYDPEGEKDMDFEQFVSIVAPGRPPLPDDAPDPKVYEFLRILDEYRIKCEEEGNYLEAGRSAQQSAALRKQEERRQNKALRARHIAERQDVQIAHNMQFAEFNAAWDRYMTEFDQMAQMYIKQMADKHGIKLKEFQQALHQELIKRPPKFSRELLDWRKRQQLLRIADELEKRERLKMDEQRLAVFEQRESKFRQQQQAELAALLKRIDVRRREHLKQREVDTKRLLQRNKNVQAVSEQKHSLELQRRKQEIKALPSLDASMGGSVTFGSKAGGGRAGAPSPLVAAGAGSLASTHPAGSGRGQGTSHAAHDHGMYSAGGSGEGTPPGREQGRAGELG